MRDKSIAAFGVREREYPPLLPYGYPHLRMTKISCEDEFCAAMVHMASPQKKMQPRITILPTCGSMGSRARMRPRGVSSSLVSRHFISEGAAADYTLSGGASHWT